MPILGVYQGTALLKFCCYRCCFESGPTLFFPPPPPFFGLFFRLSLTAYGGSHARGKIGAKLPVHIRATATQNPNHICDLLYSPQQLGIEQRNLMVASRIHFHCTTNENSSFFPFLLHSFLRSSKSFQLSLRKHKQ